jgi:NADH-quinone oxidoreductase subunit H
MSSHAHDDHGHGGHDQGQAPAGASIWTGKGIFNLALLFGVPLAAVAGIAFTFILVLGYVLPTIGLGGTLFGLVHCDPHAWVMSNWFQALVKFALMLLVVVMPFASLLTWAERRESAMMQDRLGPNRANIGPFKAWGIFHFVADAAKMIFKEDFVPAKANRFLFALAPCLAIIPVFIIFTIVPFGSDICAGKLFEVVSDPSVCSDRVTMQVARLDVGLLFYFAIASLAVYGTTLAGWASYNKWSLLGGMRASSQMMSYEVTMGLSVLGAFLVYGSLEPYGIASAQGSNVFHWGIVTQPLGALLFFVAAIAESKRAPFDIPEGESEVIGYFVEYSGMRFGTFFLAEFIEVVFCSAMMTTIFFGGWNVPFLGPDGFHFGSSHLAIPHGAVLLIQTTAWAFKIVFFCWLQLMIRWTYPRFRPDQLMNLGWKQLLPASIANIIVTAAVVLLLQAAQALPK